MRKFPCSSLLYLFLGSVLVVHPALDSSARGETGSSKEIIATINGEPLSATQAFIGKKRWDFSYFSDYDSFPTRSNLEEYRNYMRHVKKNIPSFVQRAIIEIIQNQWIEKQGITVTDEELETAWQNSIAGKKFIKNFDSEKWVREKTKRKIRYTSYREALDPKYFPKEVYQPSQIEEYTKYLEKVHKKYRENWKDTAYFHFSAWAPELLGWAGVPQEMWASFEEMLDSPGGLQKNGVRDKLKNLKIENKILAILTETDPVLKRCLNEHPKKSTEAPSENRRKCIGGKISEFWKTVYQKADIQIHDPELEPVLDLIRNP